MAKRRTILIVILSLFLAALIAAAGVFGVALARASLSDGMEASAGEARWLITSGGVSSFETEVNVLEKLRPDCTSYEVHVNGGSTGTWWTLLPDDDPGVPKMYPAADENDGSSTTSTDPRTREFFGCVATLENAGDVAATVTVTGSGDPTPNRDGCLGGDDDRYTDDEILEHLSFEVYCSYAGDAEMEDIGDGTTEKTVQRADEGDVSFDLAVGDTIYFYLLATWTTDLAYDLSDGIHDYDGVLGDEFDTWAGQHLTGITLSVRARAEQAE